MYGEHDEGTSNCTKSFLDLDSDEPSGLGLSQIQYSERPTRQNLRVLFIYRFCIYRLSCVYGACVYCSAISSRSSVIVLVGIFALYQVSLTARQKTNLNKILKPDIMLL